MTFQETLTAAVRDMSEKGYDSIARLEAWILRLRQAAEADMMSPGDVEGELSRALGATYRRLVDKGGISAQRYTIEQVRPQLHAELNRRIMASADLIKRNKAEAVEKTLQRFSGWASSVPPGGTRSTDKRAVKKTVKKALAQEPFEVRRVAIDQSHKLAANLNAITAEAGGAIAAVWKSRWRQPGYDYREPHKEIDGDVFAIRGNWAMEKGLMKAGPHGYTDQVPGPGELPFCRCSFVYMYALRDLPDEMVTQKGRDELARVRTLLAS